MAAGDLVATLSVAGQPSINFALTSNPGGFFVISGNSIFEAINTPDGNYPITLQANGPGGFSVTQPFVLIRAAGAFNIRTTNTGDIRVTNTGDTRIISP